MIAWQSALIGLSFTCLILSLVRPQKQTNSLRAKMQIIKGTRGIDGSEEDQDFTQRVLLPMLRQLAASWGSRLSKLSSGDVGTKLMLAGNPWSMTPEHFYAIKILSAALMPVLLTAFATAMGYGAYTAIWVPFGILAGWVLPDYQLDTMIKRRQAAIVNELPGVLDIFVVTTEAGLTFDAAMRRVVQSTEGVLTEEFRKVVEDISMGRRRADALRDMAERCGVEDLSVFLKSIIQAETLGASGIANTLRVYSQTTRDKLRQRIEEKGGKTAVTLLFPTVLLILPALFLVVLGPALLDIMYNFGI